MSGHFQPDASLTAQLKRRAREVVGHEFVDVRWHPEEECLAIFERHRREPPDAPGVVRTLLLDDLGEPRQLHQGDVDEVINAIYGRREAVDRWDEAWRAKQEEQTAQLKEQRRERSLATAMEMVRIHRVGHTPFVHLGGRSED